MGLAARSQDLQVLLHRLGRQATKTLVQAKGQFKQGAADVVEQNQQMVGINQPALGGTPKQGLGMMGQELVDGRRRGQQDGNRRGIAATGPPGLLIGGGQRTGIADQQGRAQPADVDAQFEGIGRHHQAHFTGAQTLFDLAPMGGQITRAVAANGAPTPATPKIR